MTPEARTRAEVLTAQIAPAFKTFADMLDAKGGYRPTIRLDIWGYDGVELSDLYDAAQAERGDPRRAFRTAPFNHKQKAARKSVRRFDAILINPDGRREEYSVEAVNKTDARKKIGEIYRSEIPQQAKAHDFYSFADHRLEWKAEGED